MEKWLFVDILVLYLIQGVFTATLFKGHYKFSSGGYNAALRDFGPRNLEELCTTEGCVMTSAEILRNMDQNTDPCQDFYSFVCGRYPLTHEIPEDKTDMSLYTEVREIVNQKIHLLLKNDIQGDDPQFVVKVKNFYKSCMDTGKIEEVGLDPILDIIAQLGGWPLLSGDDWDEDNFRWQDFVLKTKQLGAMSTLLLTIYISQDLKNNSANMMQIDQPVLSFSGIGDKDIPSDFNYHVRMAVLLGADLERAQKEVAEAINFEVGISNISTPKYDLRDFTEQYNLISIEQLEEKLPSISWLSLLNSFLPEDDKLDEEDEVIVQVPEYLKKLDSFLESTDKRVVANSLMANFLEQYMSRTTEQARSISQEYFANITGTTSQEPRWKTCTQMTAKYFDAGVGALYVRKYFKEEAKEEAVEMFRRLREEFMTILDEVTWMDPDTKREAEEKMKAMETHTGYPVELLNNSLLNEYYEDFAINPDTYFANLLVMDQVMTEGLFSTLNDLVNKTAWNEHADVTEVNAFQHYLENSIEFPAGIFQGLFFSNDRPRYMNYGSIGSIIGHELTHGFDDGGSQFDKDGNLNSWWQESTKKEYLDKIRCMIWQYGNYTSTEVEMQVNGYNTQGENVADNGGVREAYRAYNKWVSEKGPEQLLPGLFYDQKQLFWISFGSIWCGVQRPQHLRRQMLYDEHAPNRFRVIGSVSNSPEFARDFKCPAGTPMNPVHKCRVW